MEKSILFQQKKIFYNIAGKGPALILLHGFMESKSIWESFTGKLILHFTVISIDLPGHGDSEILAETHTMSLMAHAVKAVLANENISSCVVCGHSMGGYTALQLASEEPDLFKGLVLFHSQAAADSEEARENRLHTIQIVKQNHKGFIKQFIPDLFDQKHIAKYTDAIRELQETASLMKPEAINAALAGMRDRENHLELLSFTEMPVLFIAGKQDSRIPYNLVLTQAALPPYSEVLLLDNVGHMGFLEAPKETCKTLKHFALKCFED